MESVNADQFDELLEGELPVVCDFFAHWCGPCRALAPIMEDMAEKFGDKAKFVKVNIDDNMILAERYKILSIPLIAVFKDGMTYAKTVGYMTAKEAEKFLSENLK